MIDKKAMFGKSQIKGQVGENAIWDGPLSKAGFPMGKGSSSGANGMEISKASCGCGSYKLPITQRAKGQM
tara:strand:+ start:158 stop:367 length:210 start_codon:yes stop_codon:yes gene_type:complete